METLQEEERDVKPQVGPIPQAQALQAVSLGKSYFKVELMVGDEMENSSGHQLMLPFRQVHHQYAPLSTDYYVATPGLSFSIRVKLARPAKEGALYGARVYIDSGDTGEKYDYMVYKKWSNKKSQSEKDKDEDEGGIDASLADHYFYIGVGQKEHVIEGFYRSAQESQRFVFAEPPRTQKRKHDGEYRDLNTIGIIRIMFCKVVSFAKRGDHHDSSRIRKQAAVDSLLDKKIQMSAKPGSIVNHGRRVGKYRAVLSRNIVYERRLIYNTLGGFTAQQHTAFYSNRGDFYKGMPLKSLLDDRVRSLGIMAFFREVSAVRIDLSTEQRLTKSSLDKSQCDRVGTNDFVRVEDLVHYISRSLSPAGSYIISTGKRYRNEHTMDYGEKYVQKQGLTETKKLQNFALKEQGLVDFFLDHPGTYDLEGEGSNPRNRLKKNYKVRLVVLVVDSDSDDEE